MQKRLVISFLVVILVGLGVYWAYKNIVRTQIATFPVSAQVFINGKYVGKTPYFIQVIGNQSILVELKANGFFPVSYQFQSQSHFDQKELAIRLVPNYYGECSMAEDWSIALCENRELVNAQNQNNPLEVTRLSQDQTIYYSVLSPDGKIIAYATQGQQHNKFWLFSLDRPEDVTELFDSVTTDTYLIRATPLQFSPNSEWITYTGGSGPLMVASVADPHAIKLEVDDAAWGWWSKDGQWLAVILSRENRTEIYHYANNQWTPYSSVFLDDAGVAFSFDNHYLFTTARNGSNWLNVLDVTHQMRLARHYAFEGDSDSFFNPIESSNGTAFAITPNLYDSKARIQTGILLFSRFDKDIQVELKDENYQEALYWLDGDKQIATLVKRDNPDGTTSTWMKIVDVPTELSQ